MSSRLEGTQCKGKSFKRGLSRHGRKHWLSYTRQCERCFAIAGLLLEQPKSPGTFFFTALFSAYLGATVSNMLSVVSSVLAKVFLPQRQIWTFCTFGHFPGLWGRTPRLREQFSQRQNGSGRGDTVCPGGWCGSHWNRPLWSPLFILRLCMNCHSSALNTSEIITCLYFVPEAIEKRALHTCKEISNLV